MKPFTRGNRFGRAALALLAIASVLTGVAIGVRPAVASLQRADTACAPQFRALMQNPQSEELGNLARGCAKTTDDDRRAPSRRSARDDRLRLAAMHSMIPEYHDEQRLRTGPGSELGPVAGIYAAPHLGSFVQETQFSEAGDQGVLVAHIYVGKVGAEGLPGSYTDLGLDFGLNCLWLIRPSAANWIGRVRKSGTGTGCDRDDPNYTDLAVDRTSPAGNRDEYYPPVARFSDSEEGAPLFVVKCGMAVCEIGKGPFTTRRPLPVTMGGMTTPQAQVKLWHDEQELSVPRWLSATEYVFMSSAIRAAVVPVPNVHLIQLSRFRAGWVPVGSIILDSNPARNTKYERWRLTRGENRIEFMLDDFPGSVPPRPRWNVRLIPHGGGAPVPWHFTGREEHHDVAIPGTLRFRWTIMDDGIWAPCGHACCQVEG